MEPFKKITSTAAPLDLANVDTDQIIPKNFLKRVERDGFGQFLFYEWRYTIDGKEISTFVLNKAQYKGASILLARENFGCGSSREHAPWALLDYGFRVIIAPSFADIFYNNCFQNGILPIAISENEVDRLFKLTLSDSKTEYTIDLEKKSIEARNENESVSLSFEIRDALREKLLKGLDDIGWTLQFDKEISAYEQKMQNDIEKNA